MVDNSSFPPNDTSKFSADMELLIMKWKISRWYTRFLYQLEICIGVKSLIVTMWNQLQLYKKTQKLSLLSLPDHKFKLLIQINFEGNDSASSQ